VPVSGTGRPPPGPRLSGVPTLGAVVEWSVAAYWRPAVWWWARAGGWSGSIRATGPRRRTSRWSCRQVTQSGVRLACQCLLSERGRNSGRTSPGTRRRHCSLPRRPGFRTWDHSRMRTRGTGNRELLALPARTRARRFSAEGVAEPCQVRRHVSAQSVHGRKEVCGVACKDSSRGPALPCAKFCC